MKFKVVIPPVVVMVGIVANLAQALPRTNGGDEKIEAILAEKVQPGSVRIVAYFNEGRNSRKKYADLTKLNLAIDSIIGRHWRKEVMAKYSCDEWDAVLKEETGGSDLGELDRSGYFFHVLTPSTKVYTEDEIRIKINEIAKRVKLAHRKNGNKDLKLTIRANVTAKQGK